LSGPRRRSTILDFHPAKGGSLPMTVFVDTPSLGRKGRSTMPQSHPPYSPGFRQRIVELVRKGRTPEELARQFKPSAQAIRNWVKQAALDAGEHTDGLTTAEHDELRRLRREVRQRVGDPGGQGIV